MIRMTGYLLAVTAVLLAGVSAALAEGKEGGPPPGPETPPAAGAKGAAEGRVLIGPARVTLKGGRVLEAIGVVQSPDQVRVILEEGVELEFEPILVESVVALLDEQPPDPTAPFKDDGLPVGGIRVAPRGQRVGGEAPPRARRSTYPVPSAPSVSLGFRRWRPMNSLRPTRWPPPLAPTTSFSGPLEGLAEPITAFRLSVWNPRPTRWAPSIFPETWRAPEGNR